MTKNELLALAKELEVEGTNAKNTKAEIISAILNR